MDFLFGFQEKKLKPYLKMAVQRLQIAGNKKGSACKHAKREIAKLLETGKEEKARIKVEHVIREDFTMESYELIELLCELLHERVKYMSSQKECPTDLLEAVSTLIWCTDRVDIAELNEVKKQLSLKFGKEFAKAAEENATGKVNERLLDKLSVKPPSAHLVVSYLTEIAKEFDVQWQPTEIGVNDLTAPVNTPSGFSVPMAPGSQFPSVYQRHDPPPSTTSSNPYAPAAMAHPAIPPPSTTSSNPYAPAAMAHPAIPPPPEPAAPPAYQEDKTTATPISPPAPAPVPAPAPAPPPAPGANAPSFDDLEARFAALRNNNPN